MNKYIEYIRSKLDERTLLEQLAEESAEFTQATLKLIRAKELNKNYTPIEVKSAGIWEAVNNFHEEFGDMEMCLAVLGYIALDDKNMHVYAKFKRWAERLGYKDDR